MRILVADDEKDLVYALRTILEEENYTVDHVYNGLDALEYIKMTKYDAVIMDIMMPGLNGYELIKKIRDAGDKTPVIFLSAKTFIDDKIKGLDLGADDYLTKPFESKELLSRLRALIRRGKNNVSNNLKFKDLELDISSCRLLINEKEIVLPNKEFQLLQKFMFNPNRTFSGEELLNSVYSYDEDSDINLIWVYLSNIRKVLKENNSSACIKTYRGIGYRLE